MCHDHVIVFSGFVESRPTALTTPDLRDCGILAWTWLTYATTPRICWRSFAATPPQRRLEVLDSHLRAVALLPRTGQPAPTARAGSRVIGSCGTSGAMSQE
jgi:hypothetical protein